MRFIILLSASLIMLGCPKGGDLPAPAPVPSSVPSQDLQTQLAEVVPISDPKLAAFYLDYADILERDADSEIIDSTESFRKINATAGRLAFQGTDMKGKHPGLSEKLEEVTKNVLGTKNGPLDRDKAIALLKAFHWALL